ncbi:hypothetical protein J6590_063861 [Homalodisca vitripennis]|nr:hypothetical protein J6590_063861 [Homalodisca vitripennis]
MVTWYENSSNKTTLCSSHLRVPPRALVTWYQNPSKYIHTARPIFKFYRGRWSLGTKIRRSTSTLLVPLPSSTEGAGHLIRARHTTYVLEKLSTYRWLSRVNCAAYRIPPPLPQDRLTAQLVRAKVVTCWCAVKTDPQDEAQLAGRPGQLAAQSRQGRVYGGRVSGCVTGRLGCVCSAQARNYCAGVVTS